MSLHFIISDCVARARSPSELPACATSLREVTCEECLRFIDETFASWTARYVGELDVQKREIRRNAQILERQRKLIEERDRLIASSERIRIYQHPETMTSEIAQRVGAINSSQFDVDSFARICELHDLSDYEQEVVVEIVERKAAKSGLSPIGAYANGVAKNVRSER